VTDPVGGVLDRFADDIYDFDTVSPLDSWAIRMLKRFKNFLDEDVIEYARRKVRRATYDQVLATRALMVQPRARCRRRSAGKMPRRWPRRRQRYDLLPPWLPYPHVDAAGAVPSGRPICSSLGAAARRTPPSARSPRSSSRPCRAKRAR
jgi:hypothetical protein